MTQDIKTLQLAKIYESQGYYEDALKIYSFLNNRETTNEISTGLKRMEKRMEDEVIDAHPKEKISNLFEKWLRLMILEQRLDNFKKIKSRLV
jgi:hypothetical protein